MRVLDLFSGMGGWSQAFLDRGHTVLRIDNDSRFANVPHTALADILTSHLPTVGNWDVILASPPCQAFSLAASSTHMQAFRKCKCGASALRMPGEKWACPCNAFKADGPLWLEPKTDWGRTSVQLVEKVGDIVSMVQPKYWWMENPNGGMIHFVPPDVPRVQVTYCQYGEDRMKLTNIWGNWPSTWKPRPRCKNGDPCHPAAPRGAATGTRAVRSPVTRSIVPYELSKEVCLACEAAGL